MGSTNQITPTALVMAKKPLRIAENGGIRPNPTASTKAGEKQRTSAVQLVMRPHLMMKGRYSFSYMV